MKKKKDLRDVNDIASELLEVRLQKAELATKDKLLSTALKTHPEFKKQDLFEITSAVSIVMKDKEIALKWAQKHAPFLLTIDTKGAKQLFERDMKIAEGFESKLTDRLVQKGAENDKGYDIG
jgi:hypothetical protein